MQPFFTSKACPDFSATETQLSLQARVEKHLKEHGRITAKEIQDMGTTDARQANDTRAPQGNC